MWTYVSKHQHSWKSSALFYVHIFLYTFCPSPKQAVTTCGTCGTSYISPVACRCVMVEGTFAALCPLQPSLLLLSQGPRHWHQTLQTLQMCPSSSSRPCPIQARDSGKVVSTDTNPALSQVTQAHPCQEQREVPPTEHMETTFNLRLRLPHLG